MSSDPRSDVRSREPDASLIAERGAPLLEALEAKFPGAGRHAAGTASWALAIAAQLELDGATSLALRETARLHEVGRVYVDWAVAARSESELDGEERHVLDGQASIAARLAEGAGLPPAPCAWLEHWRERFGGGGPEGLAGAEIPIESRIVRAACSFDSALAASDGDPERALAAILTRLDTEIDPAMLVALDAILGGGDKPVQPGGRRPTFARPGPLRVRSSRFR